MEETRKSDDEGDSEQEDNEEITQNEDTDKEIESHGTPKKDENEPESVDTNNEHKKMNVNDRKMQVCQTKTPTFNKMKSARDLLVSDKEDALENNEYMHDGHTVKTPDNREKNMKGGIPQKDVEKNCDNLKRIEDGKKLEAKLQIQERVEKKINNTDSHLCSFESNIEENMHDTRVPNLDTKEYILKDVKNTIRAEDQGEEMIPSQVEEDDFSKSSENTDKKENEKSQHELNGTFCMRIRLILALFFESWTKQVTVTGDSLQQVLFCEKTHVSFDLWAWAVRVRFVPTCIPIEAKHEAYRLATFSQYQGLFLGVSMHLAREGFFYNMTDILCGFCSFSCGMHLLSSGQRLAQFISNHRRNCCMEHNIRLRRYGCEIQWFPQVIIPTPSGSRHEEHNVMRYRCNLVIRMENMVCSGARYQETQMLPCPDLPSNHELVLPRPEYSSPSVLPEIQPRDDAVLEHFRLFPECDRIQSVIAHLCRERPELRPSAVQNEAAGMMMIVGTGEHVGSRAECIEVSPSDTRGTNTAGEDIGNRTRCPYAQCFEEEGRRLQLMSRRHDLDPHAEQERNTHHRIGNGTETAWAGSNETSVRAVDSLEPPAVQDIGYPQHVNDGTPEAISTEKANSQQQSRNGTRTSTRIKAGSHGSRTASRVTAGSCIRQPVSDNQAPQRNPVHQHGSGMLSTRRSLRNSVNNPYTSTRDDAVLELFRHFPECDRIQSVIAHLCRERPELITRIVQHWIRSRSGSQIIRLGFRLPDVAEAINMLIRENRRICFETVMEELERMGAHPH